MADGAVSVDDATGLDVMLSHLLTLLLLLMYSKFEMYFCWLLMLELLLLLLFFFLNIYALWIELWNKATKRGA